MKKLLTAGILAVAMSLSSVAFAAADAVTYDNVTNSVKVNEASSWAAGSVMTVVVTEGDGTVINTGTIRYIDQATVSNTPGALLFQAMGMLQENGETSLPVGNYTVKIGSDNDAYIASYTFKVGELGIEIADEVVDTDNGNIWTVSLTAADSDITAFDAQFEDAEGNVADRFIRNAATAFAGKGTASFDVGLKTTRDVVRATFTIKDAKGATKSAEWTAPVAPQE